MNAVRIVPAAPRSSLARELALLCAAFSGLVSTQAGAQDALRVRVLSWNVWGIHTVSTHLDGRMAALPEAIAALEPDIVILQELWEREHGALVSRELEARGYHTHHFQLTGDGKTGLFVASKYALAPDEFRPYSIGRTPHSLWHLDWMANKGAARWIVTTPLGPISVVGTHLQAQYVTDDYAPERLSQAVELALFNREDEDSVLVLAGDFNSAASDLPRRTLVDLDELVEALPSDEPDTLYVRSGRTIEVRIVSAREVLTEAFAIGDGVSVPLSDHPAVFAELELTRRERAPRVISRDDAKKAAVSALRSASSGTPWRVAGASAGALVVVGLGFMWRRRTRRAPDTWRSAAIRLTGFVVLAVLLFWLAYLGAYYYPSRGAALTRVADQLAAVP